jgi:hypothetical protein
LTETSNWAQFNFCETKIDDDNIATECKDAGDALGYIYTKGGECVALSTNLSSVDSDIIESGSPPTGLKIVMSGVSTTCPVDKPMTLTVNVLCKAD